MISEKVLLCLENQAQKHGHLKEQIDQITLFYKERMWHQISDVLVSFCQETCFNDGNDLIELYNLFVKDLIKINPLKYSLITVSVSRQFEELEDAHKFLQEAIDRSQGKHDAIFIYKIAQAEKKLDMGEHFDCIEVLRQVQNDIKQFPDTDAKVFSKLFFTFALYYRRRNDQENYYQNSLQFLAYTNPSDLRQEEKREISIKMGMSVLLGKNIFNISELLDKEILNSLKGTDFEWLFHLLSSLGTGKIQEFLQGLETYQEQIQKFPQIAKETTHLQQKVRIVALLELIFRADKDQRSLKFDFIAGHCQVEQSDVEFLLMKAMALNLIKGVIDEVAQVVHIDWIKPRYLTKEHMGIMAERLRNWQQTTEDVIRLVEAQSEELLAS